MDANANVTHKNIATMENELMKDFLVQVEPCASEPQNQRAFRRRMGAGCIRQIEAHEIYVHDETSLKPYCVSVTLYPFLRDGLAKLGGESQAPKHLASFCGSFVNLVFAISAQFAGAVATVEFLTSFRLFRRRDYGDDYLSTHAHEVANHLQHVVYGVDQPAAARGYQSVFWNISLYDAHYFEAMFGDFVFPDFTKPEWQSVARACKIIFSNGLIRSAANRCSLFRWLPAAMLTDNGECKDKQFADEMAQELAEGNSFFVYSSDNPDSLASCCRLRNQIDDRTFSYTLGAGGVATGSINVITLNMNRLEQDGRDLAEEVAKLHRYQYAYRKLMEEYQAAGMLPVYDAGFITLDKQFLTIGINGMAEAAEACGIEVGYNPEYIEFVQGRLKTIFEANKAAAKTIRRALQHRIRAGRKSGAKNAQWDKADGYKVARDCYNSYFYVVEDDKTNALDKILLHGHKLTEWLDGGSALHLNRDETLSQSAAIAQLLNVAARTGCNYFCVNVKITSLCNECGHIDKRTREACSACGSRDIDYGTRVIGYLKRRALPSAAPAAQEHALRHYHRHAA